MMKLRCVLFIALSLGTLNCYAQGSHVGGGDQCKNEIDKYRLQILGWIQRDEAKDLNFTVAQVEGLTYEAYKQKMIKVLQEGQVIVTCYLDPARISDPVARSVAEREGVSYKSITIGIPAEPVTCINYEGFDGISHIDCNYDAILTQAASGSPNYGLTHHEYASIAGVEMRSDSSISDFSISNQLGQFEHWQTIKVLGPKGPDVHAYQCSFQISKDNESVGILSVSIPDHSPGIEGGGEAASIILSSRNGRRGRIYYTRIVMRGTFLNQHDSNQDIGAGTISLEDDYSGNYSELVSFKGINYGQYRSDFTLERNSYGFKITGGCSYR